MLYQILILTNTTNTECQIELNRHQSDKKDKHEYDSDNPQTVHFVDEASFKCGICKQEKAISAFSKNQRRKRNISNWKCKSCVEKLKLSPNYVQF